MLLAEAAMLEDVLKSLLASGPLAIVLGFACAKLWAKLEDMAAKNAAEEEKIRGEAAAERLRLEAKLDAQNKEYVELVKQLTSAAAKDHKEGA